MKLFFFVLFVWVSLIIAVTYIVVTSLVGGRILQTAFNPYFDKALQTLSIWDELRRYLLESDLLALLVG